MATQSNDVRVYTVNGAAAGSSLSLPDWLTRKREAKSKGKRALKEHYEGSIELIQGFEFPEASNRIKTTRDGHHVVATGTYKPQIRVWDLDQLTLKFERHSDAENVDFILLSDDWTKQLHLQNDRTVELHTQGGFHYRTRIPKFGRSLAYHFPSCDTYLAASGNEVYRLNLEQGRFLNPLVLQDDEADDILGVNVIDINPAHQLIALGIDGNGTVQFWDPRSRTSVGILRLPRHRLVTPNNVDQQSLAVTALSSRADGLSYAVGTSTGHTLLYDIRTTTPFAIKDQGYGLPVKNTVWIEGGSRMAGDGMILSADQKVIKIWDRNSPGSNFVSVTPATDLNDVHHIPGSGLLLTANEGIQMSTFYIPQLGPAPRWASFLENITEEMEDQTTRSIYEDYKFVERSELSTLGLDHLIGTPALKPYMHGYFLSLKLYDTARVIANPFAYEEHRERLVREKMDQMAETRIRAKKDPGVKVNKVLAERLLKEEERRREKEERRKKRKQPKDTDEAMEVDADAGEEGASGFAAPTAGQTTVLSDPRFKKVFEDPAFTIDENTREFALLHPSAFAQNYAKTAVEEEEEESDHDSSDDGFAKNESSSDDDDDDDENSGLSSDSSAAGELTERAGRDPSRPYRLPKVAMVPVRTHRLGGATNDKNTTFGQRRMFGSGSSQKGKGASFASGDDNDGATEISWVPSTSSHQDGGDGKDKTRKKSKSVERFGASLERGEEEREEDMDEAQRKGRTHRRHGVRSGSKNMFRKMDGK